MQLVTKLKMKRSWQFAAAATFSIVLAACSSSTSSETAAPAESAAAAASDAAPDALATAWANDWATLGITNPGITPTDKGITTVDTTKYKKDGPYTIAFASQGPTNSWATI